MANDIPKTNFNKRRRLRVEDPDFEPPDGKWGWVIVVAAGIGNFCLLPPLQQFGLIFREKLSFLGITASEVTTIINLNCGLTSLLGLINGPMFRKFSFRQISLAGAVLCAVSFIFLAKANSFLEYILSFSILYGLGMGLSLPANALALNTYFLKKRRIATGLAWTATALGPIVMPHLISLLMFEYGVEGTTLIYAGIACNAIVCALLLQPVHWHTKYRDEVAIVESQIPLIQTTDYDIPKANEMRRNETSHSLFSNKIFFNDDDLFDASYEIIEPGTPMLSAGNDGWYSLGKRSLHGSKLSLTSSKGRNYNDSDSKYTSTHNLSLSPKLSVANFQEFKAKNLSNVPIEMKKRKISRGNNNLKIDEVGAEDCPSLKAEHDLEKEQRKLLKKQTLNQELYKNNINVACENEVLKNACDKLEKMISDKEEIQNKKKANIPLVIINEDEDNNEENISFLKKVIIFFDLDLLTDPVYVNIMIGVTLGWFSELNFSILTPFVLGDYGYTNEQIATFLSLLGGVDISVRFLIPFVAGKIGLSNRTFFMIGIGLLAIGRVMLIYSTSYVMGLQIAVVIGFGKGLRTIFMALAIPSYVSIVRLPAATGLQLLTAGIFSLAFGPVVGYIRDTSESYALTLHFLNIMTLIVIISWTTEKIIFSRKQKKGDILKTNET